MTRNGAGLSMDSRKRIRYGALLVLAIVAFGLAGLALANQRGAGEAVKTVSVIPPAAPPTTSATPSATAPPAPMPSATVAPQQLGIKLPPEPVLLILGDSYTAGVGADRTGEGWAYLVANSLGYPTNIDGVPGTGFAWGGGVQDTQAREYEVRLQEIAEDPRFIPNVLILQGGQNDSLLDNPNDVQNATVQTIEAARRFWPGVQVVVLGPSAPQPIAEELRDANSAVRAGAAAARAPFIDAYEAGWFTVANSTGFKFDGVHPNTAGHAHIAEKFLESWATLVQ